MATVFVPDLIEYTFVGVAGIWELTDPPKANPERYQNIPKKVEVHFESTQLHFYVSSLAKLDECAHANIIRYPKQLPDVKSYRCFCFVFFYFVYKIFIVVPQTVRSFLGKLLLMVYEVLHSSSQLSWKYKTQPKLFICTSVLKAKIFTSALKTIPQFIHRIRKLAI